MTDTAAPPTAVDLADRLRIDPSTDGLGDAVTAALASQAAYCETDPYTTALREAAIRRAVREWSSRPFPLGIADMSDLGAVRVGRDPLIAELEAPYLRRTFA